MGWAQISFCLGVCCCSSPLCFLPHGFSFVVVLRCVHDIQFLFHLCTASVGCNRVYTIFTLIQSAYVRPRWVILASLRFDIGIFLSFPCIFFALFVSRFVFVFCFCVEQPTMRACVSLCVWVLKHCLGYFYGSQYTFTSRMTVEIERLRQNEAWIFHLNFVFVSTNDDSLEFNSILMGDTGHKRILPFFLCKIDFLFESNGCNGFEFLNWKSPEEKQQSASC